MNCNLENSFVLVYLSGPLIINSLAPADPPPPPLSGPGTNRNTIDEDLPVRMFYFDCFIFLESRICPHIIGHIILTITIC
jgi:hypothetical protein